MGTQPPRANKPATRAASRDCSSEGEPGGQAAAFSDRFSLQTADGKDTADKDAHGTRDGDQKHQALRP